MADIPDDFPLSSLQRVVREAVLAERPQAHGDLATALAAIEAPVRHLDFETFMPAIPRYAGTHPYQTIPFLFSVHTERPGRAPDHGDYLHEGDDDPRPALTRRLLAALGERGSICVYSVYERRILRALARALPQHQRALAAVEKRLIDLHPIVKHNYYHPAFRGSFSIKAVLPALCPRAGYDDLAIATASPPPSTTNGPWPATPNKNAAARSPICEPIANATPWRSCNSATPCGRHRPRCAPAGRFGCCRPARAGKCDRRRGGAATAVQFKTNEVPKGKASGRDRRQSRLGERW